jgi:hypothetical protein
VQEKGSQASSFVGSSAQSLLLAANAFEETSVDIHKMY